MKFGWTNEEKEKYFIKAEQQIEAAGFTSLLVIDRTSFGINGTGKVKVFIQPFHRHGFTRHWWEAKRTMENLHEQEPPKNQFGKREKTILIHGYMLMEMEEGDK